MLDVIPMIALSINIVWCVKTYQRFDLISQVTGVPLFEVEFELKR